MICVLTDYTLLHSFHYHMYLNCIVHFSVILRCLCIFKYAVFDLCHWRECRCSCFVFPPGAPRPPVLPTDGPLKQPFAESTDGWCYFGPSLGDSQFWGCSVVCQQAVPVWHGRSGDPLFVIALCRRGCRFNWACASVLCHIYGHNDRVRLHFCQLQICHWKLYCAQWGKIQPWCPAHSLFFLLDSSLHKDFKVLPPTTFCYMVFWLVSRTSFWASCWLLYALNTYFSFFYGLVIIPILYTFIVFSLLDLPVPFDCHTEVWIFWGGSQCGSLGTRSLGAPYNILTLWKRIRNTENTKSPIHANHVTNQFSLFCEFRFVFSTTLWWFYTFLYWCNKINFRYIFSVRIYELPL